MAAGLARRISGRVQDLVGFMRRVGDGDLDARADFGGSREFRQLSDALNRMIADPEALNLTRSERTIMFMDIRGFTSWSESRMPEEVVAMLNRYYDTIEMTLKPYAAIKSKF